MFFIWVTYLCALGYSLADALWINIDETAIKYHFTKMKGYQAQAPNQKMKKHMVEKVTSRDAKSHCTLISAIASEQESQTQMPQVFIPNTTGRKKNWQEAKNKNIHNPNVMINLDTQGWMTIEFMLVYLDILAERIKELGKNKVVLVMDCLAAHISIKVLKKINRLKWKVLLIPSKLTWLLQPLDVWMFSNVKRNLYLAQVENQIKSTTGTVSFQEWSTTVFGKIQTMFVNTEVRQKFEKCGFKLPTNNMPKHLLPYMPHESLGKVRKLTMAELTMYMGSRCDACYKLLFKENIPHDLAHHMIVLQSPMHRLSSKRSLSSLHV